ncbi:MAG: MFS transporter [Cyanobacteria bacterium P01_F01_bin.143]
MLILCTSVAIDFIGYGIIVPLLPFYAQSFGASPIVISWLLSVFLFMQLFAPTLWGILSDRFGRRPALLLNIAGTSLSLLWLGLSNSLSMLFGARVLAGASGSSFVIAQSYIADITEPKNRTRDLGFLQASSGVGFLIGPAIGGLLVGNDPSNPNFALPGLFAGGISLVTLSFAFVFLPKLKRNNPIAHQELKSRKLVRSIAKVLQRPLIAQLSGIFSLAMFAGMGAQAVLPLWCEHQFDWGPKQFSYLVIFCGVLGAIVSIGLLKPLTRILGEPKLLLGGLLIVSVGLILISFSTDPPLFLAGIALAICGQAITKPVITSLFSQLAEPKQQGKTLGLANSFSGLASFLGTIWAGFVFQLWGPNSPYLIGSILILIAAIFSWALGKKFSTLS